MSDAAPALALPPRRSTARAWFQLLRPHFIAFSLGCGVVGMAAGAQDPSVVGILLGITVTSTGYPFGVIVNDYLDRKADAINAPDRPFVTGEIDPRFALAAISLLAGVQLALALVVAPAIAVWSAIAIVGHVAYGLAKGVPMLGNLVNGEMALFTVIGAAAAAPDRSWTDIPGDVWWITGLIAIALAGFCLVGYFKDVPGDAAAGYRTLPVAIGPQRAKWWTIPFPIAAVGLAAGLVVADPDALGAAGSAWAFWPFAALAAGAFALSLRELIAAPTDRAYEALLWYTRGTLLFILALGAAVEPVLFVALSAPFVAFLELTLRGTRTSRQA